MAALKKFKMLKEKCRNPASATLTCPSQTFFLENFFSAKLFNKITLTTLVKGVYLFDEPSTCYFDRTPAQGLLSKQKHSPKVILEEAVLKIFLIFMG